MRSALRSKALQYQPDKAEAPDATAQFRRVREAYGRIMSVVDARVATECRANNASVTTVFSPKSSSCPSDATHADAATFRCGTVRKAVVMAALKNKFFFDLRLCDDCWSRWWCYQAKASVKEEQKKS